MTPAVPKVSTCTVNVEALIRNPRSGISSGCGGGASQCVGRREITVLAGCAVTFSPDRTWRPAPARGTVDPTVRVLFIGTATPTCQGPLRANFLPSSATVRLPIVATHPPFAATMAVPRGRQSRSTYQGNDLRNGSSLACPAMRIAGRAVVPCQGRRAPCDSPCSERRRLRRGHVTEGKSAAFSRKQRDPKHFKALAHGQLRPRAAWSTESFHISRQRFAQW
jgi:hypothetical protein